MNTERRLAILESNLSGRDRAIAWLKRVQAIGGFVDYCAALAKAKAPQLDADETNVAFIFGVVVQCNVQVLEMAVPNESLPLFALYLLRIECSEMIAANPVELGAPSGSAQNFYRRRPGLRESLQASQQDSSRRECSAVPRYGAETRRANPGSKRIAGSLDARGLAALRRALSG